MKKRKRVLVLLSGGLDSAVLAVDYVRQGYSVLPVYVRFGLQWETIELKAIRRFLAAVAARKLRPLVVLDSNVKNLYGSAHWSLSGKRVPGSRSPDSAVYLPGRNLILLSKASTLAAIQKIPTIALGTLSANPFGDATPAFFRTLSKAASTALAFPLRIEAPYRKITKAQLMRKFADAPFHLSFSCIRPVRGKHCGRCNKCQERKKAFRIAKISDKTAYAYAQ